MGKTRDEYVQKILDCVMDHACAEAHMCSVAEYDIPVTMVGAKECREKVARLLDEWAKERD